MNKWNSMMLSRVSTILFQYTIENLFTMIFVHDCEVVFQKKKVRAKINAESAAEARFLAHKRATSYYWNLRVIKAKHVQNKSHYIEKCWQAYSAQTVLFSFGNCQNSESDYDHESKWIRGQKGHYMLHIFFSFFAKWQITNIPKRWNMAV